MRLVKCIFWASCNAGCISAKSTSNCGVEDLVEPNRSNPGFGGVENLLLFPRTGEFAYVTAYALGGIAADELAH